MKSLFVSCFDNFENFPEQVEAVFVVHQDVFSDQIADLVRENGFNSVLVVSSHAPFPDELEAFRGKLCQAQVWWSPMSFLLNDTEMEKCDEQAVLELTGNGQRMEIGLFLRRSRFLRNAVACQNLARRVRWSRCFASSGLGVDIAAWPNASILGSQPTPVRSEKSEWLARMINWLKCPAQKGRQTWLSFFARRLFRPSKPYVVEIVEDGRECYVFVCDSTNRLRFRKGVRLHRWESARRRFSKESDIDTICGLVGKAVEHFRSMEPRISTTVHGYSSSMLERFPNIRVFVDGLHPPNYPISYGAGYRGAIIVSRENCDREWFEKCGCKVLPPANILALELPYRMPNSFPPFQNVCLMLNHAGDWSALIDRSDTDMVVMEFVDAAARHPELSFRVRAHPTMATKEHEGLHSFERLQRWVLERKLGNLEFSSGTIDDDMSWTDVCVSEYSNVLVDCLKNGKVCFALNPTNRRSFLDHLSSYGLLFAKNGAELAELLKTKKGPGILDK